MCASTFRKEKPPQPCLGLPRVTWLPEKAMEGSFGGFFFSGVVEERHDTPERVRKQTLVEAREARFFFSARLALVLAPCRLFSSAAKFLHTHCRKASATLTHDLLTYQIMRRTPPKPPPPNRGYERSE